LWQSLIGMETLSWTDCRRRSAVEALGRDIIDITLMGQLIVRNVEDKLVRALKVRAAAHGRSAEAEHREILREALAPARSSRTLKDALLSIPAVGDDADFERPRDTGRKLRI
jgi:plasmid stability protein